MSSKEDYLDNLLKNITHTTEASHPEASHPEASHPEASYPEEEKTIDENVQPEVEFEQESGISVPEQEQEPEVSVPEQEQEPEVSVPEQEQESVVSVSEFEQESEVSVLESEQESVVSVPESEQESEVLMQDPGAENILETKTEYQEDFFSVEENGTPDIAEEIPTLEESEDLGVEESEVSESEVSESEVPESEVPEIEESEIPGIVENEIPNIEPEEEVAAEEITIPEEEPEEEVVAEEITMPEEEPEWEAAEEMPMPEEEPEEEVVAEEMLMPEEEAEWEAAEEMPMPEEEPEEEVVAEEITMPEEEPEAETAAEMSMPEEEAEWEAAEEITMPEEEPEWEAAADMSMQEEEHEPELELENIMEEALASQEVEIPDMEEADSSGMEEAEIPDMEENELSGTSEDEISGIEELIADMGEDISDMKGNNLTEDDETLDVEELLSGIGDFADIKEDGQEGESLNSDQVPALDDVMEMSEDDIEKLLSKGFVEESVESADTSEQDVLDILEGTAADEDLQDIQDMLQKSDNNEAVDDEIVKLLQGVPEDGENLEERILSEDGNLTGTGSEELDVLIGDPKKQKALEKKRRKEEKAAARKAAKEAAKAKKAAKKRAKKAKKTRQNKNVQDIPIENENGEELFFDRDELDRLVSKAGQIGDEEPETEVDEEPGNAGEDDFGLNLNDLFAGDEGSGEDALQALTAMHTDESGSGDSEAAADKKKKKKEKKEKAEKTGFLSKILSFLMEEDEEDEKEGNLRLSEENQGILNDLDRQGKTVKGGKGGTGGKKDKKKDDKKEKPKKEAKPKKEPKPKAEKPPREPEPYVPPRKRLTPKKVLPVVLLGITVAAAILIFVNVSTDYVDKRAAKTAYYNGDYATCYQNLNGKELNETEAVMYGRSESILYIRLWYREYEMFVEEGSEVKALDSLIQTVKDYPMLYEYASKWHAEGDVYTVYADILNILLDKYGITELQAKEIAKERDDLKYTRMVVALAEGKPYGSWNQTGASVEDDSLPHELPEESDLGQGNFVDNR